MISGISSCCCAVSPASSFFMRSYIDALVRGMHIHQHHAVGGLRQDVDAVQLRDRIAQGRRTVDRAARRRRRSSALARRARFAALKQAAVGIRA